MQIQNKNKCLIYCRVSTKEQVEEGNSLITQEKTCKEYAEKNDYEVIDIYREAGESAKTVDRTELQKLLKFCSEKRNGISTIIIYKIDRLSRNTDDYSQLRLLLKKYGVDIKSTSEQISNSPVGKFMENTLANIAQFDNDIRAERCSGGMLQAVREGRYVWKAPIGYINTKVLGKATIEQSLVANLIRETFELIATGNYAVEDVRKIMTNKGLRIGNNKIISDSYFHEILKNKLYCGIIEKFGETHKSGFDPIISDNLFNQVQRIIRNKGKKVRQYKKDHEDFPLRRFIFDDEGRKITASWVTGRSKKYPQYRFIGNNKIDCKWKNIRKETLEEDFKKYLDKYRLDDQLINRLKKKVENKFGLSNRDKEKNLLKTEKELEELREKQSLIIDKNIKGLISDETLKNILEKVEKDIFNKESILLSSKEESIDIDEVLSFTEAFIKDPSDIWNNASLDKKLKLQWFQFPKGIVLKNEKFETAEVASIFNIKSILLDVKSVTVDPSGFEPLTSGVQNRRSTK